jgi:hypothetical protein
MSKKRLSEEQLTKAAGGGMSAADAKNMFDEAGGVDGLLQLASENPTLAGKAQDFLNSEVGQKVVSALESAENSDQGKALKGFLETKLG